VPGPFARLNDRAKQVLALAQDEAIRFGHSSIGPEHLLLGMVSGREGVAARALGSLGIDHSRVRSAVETIVGRGDSTTTRSEISLSPRTKRVIELAIDDARRSGHSHAGTEHLLLAMGREGGSVVAEVLRSLGVDMAMVRSQVLATLGLLVGRAVAHTGVPVEATPALELSGDVAGRVIALAENEAIGLGHTWVGTEHLVLGLMAANGSTPQRVLTELGLTIERVRAQVNQLPSPRAEWQTRDLSMTPRAKQLLDEAANRYVYGRVPESLLVSLVRDRDSSGGKVLDTLNVTEPMIFRALRPHSPPSL
jgi:ATP-dependent Clp protease ATP-binding subunit ClpA